MYRKVVPVSESFDIYLCTAFSKFEHKNMNLFRLYVRKTTYVSQLSSYLSVRRSKVTTLGFKYDTIINDCEKYANDLFGIGIPKEFLSFFSFINCRGKKPSDEVSLGNHYVKVDFSSSLHKTQ